MDVNLGGTLFNPLHPLPPAFGVSRAQGAPGFCWQESGRPAHHHAGGSPGGSSDLSTWAAYITELSYFQGP